MCEVWINESKDERISSINLILREKWVYWIKEKSEFEFMIENKEEFEVFIIELIETFLWKWEFYSKKIENAQKMIEEDVKDIIKK